jgi:hypothetical protein
MMNLTFPVEFDAPTVLVTREAFDDSIFYAMDADRDSIMRQLDEKHSDD